MVIEARRLNRTTIQVSVTASPAGPLAKPVKTALSDSLADALRPSHSHSLPSSDAGHAGQTMAAALLPAAVYERLYVSVGRAKDHRGAWAAITVNPRRSAGGRGRPT
jgi:hypothetical protein